MTISLTRCQSVNFWEQFGSWVTSTEHRLCIYRLIPCNNGPYSIFRNFSLHYSFHRNARPIDIHGIREPFACSFHYGNYIFSGSVILSSNAIDIHFYPISIKSTISVLLTNDITTMLSSLELLQGYFFKKYPCM